MGLLVQNENIKIPFGKEKYQLHIGSIDRWNSSPSLPPYCVCFTFFQLNENTRNLIRFVSGWEWNNAFFDTVRYQLFDKSTVCIHRKMDNTNWKTNFRTGTEQRLSLLLVRLFLTDQNETETTSTTTNNHVYNRFDIIPLDTNKIICRKKDLVFSEHTVCAPHLLDLRCTEFLFFPLFKWKRFKLSHFFLNSTKKVVFFFHPTLGLKLVEENNVSPIINSWLYA